MNLSIVDFLLGFLFRFWVVEWLDFGLSLVDFLDLD